VCQFELTSHALDTSLPTRLLGAKVVFPGEGRAFWASSQFDLGLGGVEWVRFRPAMNAPEEDSGISRKACH
jgi:hypothetical protein